MFNIYFSDILFKIWLIYQNLFERFYFRFFFEKSIKFLRFVFYNKIFDLLLKNLIYIFKNIRSLNVLSLLFS